MAAGNPNRGVQRQRPRSRLARREIPARRSGRNSPSSQTAIRRWRNPRLLPRQQPWAGAPAWGGARRFIQRTGQIRYPVPAAGASPRPTGRNVSVIRWISVHPGGGTHRSRPTNHMGSPSGNVGRHLCVPPCGTNGHSTCAPGRMRTAPHPGPSRMPAPTTEEKTVPCRMNHRNGANAYRLQAGTYRPVSFIHQH